MSDVVIRVENLWKQYRYGTISHATLRKDFQSWWARIRGKEDPNLPLGMEQSAKSKALDSMPYVPGTMPDPDRFWALHDVSFEVKQGEVLGIIGRNGAGKSTLLKVMSRVTTPTKGEIKIRGRVASLLEVGTGFHPELTGRENIFLNGAILGMTKDEIKRKFDEIVAFAEVERFIDTPVKRYSSGMYVRLAFAVAAHLDPEILVVDEVLAVGDAEFQKKCLGKMETVARQGRTVLFVSHNIPAIERLCTVALLLDKGEMRRFDHDVASVAREYLFSKQQQLESIWVNHNPEEDNGWFTPLRFSLADEAGNGVTMPVRNDQNLRVTIEGVLKKYSPALTIGYALYDEDDSLLYWTYYSDAPEEKQPQLRVGQFALSAPIPRRLLNEGTYRIELIAGIHYQFWLLEPGVNAPSLVFTIQGGLSDSPHWTARRPGRLAPVIEWHLMTNGRT
jgi:lipopolysaccharide transport system ATP-binding protein